MRTFLFLALSGIALSPLQAGVISLETSITTEVKRDTLYATLTVTSKGNEAANNIQISAKSPIASKTSGVLPSLPVGKSHSESFEWPLRGLAPGRYPLINQITYTDANLYPFSALAVSVFKFQQEASSLLLGVLGSARIDKSGRINLSLKNLDAQPKTLNIALITPREISVEEPLRSMTLRAGEELKLVFKVRNFSALKGSTYSVYAVMEYEEGGLHHTTLAPGSIEVMPPSLWGTFRQYQGSLLIVLLAFFGLIGGRIYFERRSPRRG